VALAPQDRTHLEESAPEPPKIAEENGKLSENPEKRIDNAPKRNYIDLQQVKASLTEDELCLAELLGETWQQVDEIIDKSGLPAARVMASLTLLEVKGVIQRSAGNLFALNFKD
jgi:predicted Rossmann fold nucleotide-binding protein DprA/Smf involved in DNA uptake